MWRVFIRPIELSRATHIRIIYPSIIRPASRGCASSCVSKPPPSRPCESSRRRNNTYACARACACAHAQYATFTFQPEPRGRQGAGSTQPGPHDQTPPSQHAGRVPLGPQPARRFRRRLRRRHRRRQQGVRRHCHVALLASVDAAFALAAAAVALAAADDLRQHLPEPLRRRLEVHQQQALPGWPRRF